MKIAQVSEKVESVTTLLRESDWDTFEHSVRVAGYAVKLGRALEVSRTSLDRLYLGALVHDVGKLMIPKHILNKPGPLTKEEFEVVKRHPESGAVMLRELTGLEELLPITLYHHERFDGTGYPFGLRGEAIPFEARVVCVADAYEAMTSHRVYRPRLSHREAVQQLLDGRGTQFDPRVVERFLEACIS
jgi:putative nucleotidyltransferase with HDIG domain